MNDADLQRRPIIALAYRTPDGRKSTVGTAALINRVVVTTSPAGEQTYVLNMYGLCRMKFVREIVGENDVDDGVVLKLCTPIDRLKSGLLYNEITVDCAGFFQRKKSTLPRLTTNFSSTGS